MYECGEPTIGSSFVQFDLRFYVVALLFIIFDVEVAFFFPWANVFGKATQLKDRNLVTVQSVSPQDPGGKSGLQLTPAAAGLLLELGVREPRAPNAPTDEIGKAVPLKPNQTILQQRATAVRMGRDAAGVAVAVGHRRVLRGAVGRLRVCVAARRFGLGAGG